MMPQENQGIRRNALIFGISTIVLHVLTCFMFGFFFRLGSDQPETKEFYPIFIAFAHGMLVLIGFGLLFSYLRKMLWTGLGFTLLITALSVEMYFMMNVFWSKAGIIDISPDKFKDSQYYNFSLANLNLDTPQLMASITGGFRCGLANLVAFSAIIGRAGPLEALFVVIFGTIGYELNRQIIQRYSIDSGGTCAIFIFGGFMGLILGVFRYLSERNESQSTAQHENYTANRFSASFALMGTLMTWIFFPILSMDYSRPDALHTVYTGPASVLFALCAATLTSFLLSPIFNDGILIRDIIYGPIAGGVASSTASYWILNPAYALATGVLAAALQIVVMNLIEKKVAREMSIFHTYSFTLFGAQGLLGAICAAIWNAGVIGQSYGFPFQFPKTPVFSWVISLISAPMGALFGLAAGLLCLLVASHQRADHFQDFTYWHNDDGLRMFKPGDPEVEIRENVGVIKGARAYL